MRRRKHPPRPAGGGNSHVPASPTTRGRPGLSVGAPGGGPRKLEDFQMGAEFFLRGV